MTPQHSQAEAGDFKTAAGARTGAPTWSTPSTVTDAARRLFDSGVLLRALHDEATRERAFPVRVRLRGPGRDELADCFATASDWTRRLRRDASTRGWRLTTKTVTSRTLGRQDLPASGWLDTPDITLALLNGPARRQSARFAQLLDIAQGFAATAPAVARAGREVALAQPHAILDAADDWSVMLAVSVWLAEHPRPDVDIRQLPVPGAHTKLLEQRRRVVSALFDACLPEQAIDSDAGTFEQKYGFASRSRQIQLHGPGSALGLPWADQVIVGWPLWALAGFSPQAVGITEVVLVENRVSFAAIPAAAGRLTIFGEGYAAEDTAEQAPWLTRVRVRYWGDIDTHGLRILARLRRSLPHTESVLMDQDTLVAHRDRWVTEKDQARPEAAEALLTETEAELLAKLRDNTWGRCVRLEQEHVSLTLVRAAFV